MSILIFIGKIKHNNLQLHFSLFKKKNFFSSPYILINDCSVFCDFCKQMRNQTTRHGASETRTIQKMIDNDCQCEVS